jgi:hypothetical protein
MKRFLLAKIKENSTLTMVVCCAVPLIAIWIFSSLGVLGSWGYYGLMLLCPLLHIMMCRKGHSSHHSGEEPQRDYSESTSIDEFIGRSSSINNNPPER